MDVQRELWATQKEFHLLRVDLERLWLADTPTWDLTWSCRATKGEGPVWFDHQELVGPHSVPVAVAITEAIMLRCDSAGWASKPLKQDQERWERHLHTM